MGKNKSGGRTMFLVASCALYDKLVLQQGGVDYDE